MRNAEIAGYSFIQRMESSFIVGLTGDMGSAWIQTRRFRRENKWCFPKGYALYDPNSKRRSFYWGCCVLCCTTFLPGKH